MKTRILFLIIFILIGIIIIQFFNKQHTKCDKEKAQLKETFDSLIGWNRKIEELHYPDGYLRSEFLYPKEGLVSNYKTAIKIAEYIWLEKFGNTIYKEKPFNAVLVADSLWIITGSLPENTAGGTLYIEINKKDGKIYRSIHEK